MPINRWWASSPEEICWLETTDRAVLGVDLASPQTDDAGHEHHGYTLVREVEAGDVVFHYHTKQRAIVGWSRATGSFWEEDIVWAAHGTVARVAGVTPYKRRGYRHGLEGPFLFELPITLEDLRAVETTIKTAREIVADGNEGTLYFPFALSDKRPLRPTQFYLTKFPVILTELFPQLEDAVKGTTPRPTQAAVPLALAPPEVSFGISYQAANEQAATSERDPFEVDPNVVDRSLRSHAHIQNEVARYAESLGYRPLSPSAVDPRFDLAWQTGNTCWVVEVKSLTEKNEEQQLRLGLGQLLRYRNLLTSSFRSVKAVLAVEREPTDPSWRSLLDELDIILTWPGNLADALSSIST